MEQELIGGTIAAVVFQNQQNGYAVVKLNSEDGASITVVGTIPTPIAGERLLVTGKWSTHASYGRQFEAEFLERLLPETTAQILAYLSSRAVRGIGPKTAEKLVKHFGESTLKVLEREPERLTEVSGVSPKKAREMGESFRTQVGVRRLIELLSSYHISPEIAMRAYRLYGQESVEIVHTNPYLLTQAELGAPFAAADRLALELGFDGDDARRVEAGVLFELRHNLNNGHTFLPQDKLTAATAALLELDESFILPAIERLRAVQRVYTQEIGALTAVYLPEYFQAEQYIAQRVLKMSQAADAEIPHAQAQIAAIEHSRQLQYADLQREAICAAAQKRILILTGGPGTGKTTTLAGILAMFDRLRYKTLLAAPTGRAAKRLSELTECEASTIHRLLEVQVSPETGEMFFLRGESEPLGCDALIVDEVSMVDLLLMESLLRALPEKGRLILVGDPDQLPSVGAGNLFSDLIRSGAIKTICLTEIFRQARESLIVMNAHAVNHGQLPALSVTDRDFFFMKRRSAENVVQTIAQLCAQRLPQNMGVPADEIQVISPTRKGETGTYNLNIVLQNALNPKSAQKKEVFCGTNCFREGDRVMQIRNNYDILWKRIGGGMGAGIFNGDIGIVRSIDHTADAITIRFDDREAIYDADMLTELELAYAITAHKSQGSEYRAVIFAVYSGAPMLLTRGVLYTAITRARELLILVGNEEIVAQMTENNRRNKRYSGLRLRLMQSL
ncbi:MAG: ATP-dependent RecD-like DNA helicase [Oscillospiraceae bacterium]|nr:ATP-dependent RecD-like DNA helicase [Oscillospiraceae bacterium]